MRYCDFCGEEILGTPYRRRRQYYCSRSCADEHELELAGEIDDDDDDDDDLDEESEDDE
ncbi:MAG: TRASH domain-containing protein [candidate division Zixibacteria bacterium]|nr:TRASH domain-containing protein [candidate division Zixibacteria bacterium]